MTFSLSFRPAPPFSARPSTAPRRGFAPSLRTALLGALAVLAGPCAAQAQGPVKAQQLDAHTLAFTVENPDRQRVHLQVVAERSAHYRRLLNEVHRQPSYGTKLGFDHVPAGEYAVLLRVGRERYRYQVQVPAAAATAISVRELTPALAPSLAAR